MRFASGVVENLVESWLVTEHVHAPDGRYLGDVRQRRTIEQLGGHRLSVTQECTADDALDDHPLGALHGPWVHELEIAGSRRRHHGPDVIGHGTEWVPGAVTARVHWPRLGCTASTWSILLLRGRQITGSWFEVAGRPVAVTVGVGVPEEERAGRVERPVLDLRAQPALPLLGAGAATAHHRVGPLLVVDSWFGPEHTERRIIVTDAGAGLTATLLVSESGGTRLGDVEIVPVG